MLAQNLRNDLRTMVQEARRLLTKDLVERLEGDFGIHRDGRFESVEGLPRVHEDERASEARSLLERLLPPEPETEKKVDDFQDEFDRLIRSLAFTHLNRLVAFKVLEHPDRRLIRETVGRGADSNGVKFYMADRPEEEREWRRGARDGVYQRFLLHRACELDSEIGVLFDPEDVASHVFPRPPALDAVLELLNEPSLAPVWRKEEALGWVYQYYTPEELRKKVRNEAKSGPRNSYELAIRNQFYTPHYVVRFLTDNTLGRLWVAMHSKSRLYEQCELLAVADVEELEDRAPVDPRELKVLDPACGSGHFLLYAFELLQVIYEEAYRDDHLGTELHRVFPDEEEFEASIPKLIVENNLYGIDIDERAVQIASLALYVKAKTASPEVEIERSNLVVAAPMPGDKELFDSFKGRELEGTNGSLARMLDGFWEHLQLAGEAGSLLKVEEKIKNLVKEEHQRWLASQSRAPGSQTGLWAEFSEAGQRELDFSDVDDETFFYQAAETLEALFQRYADEADGAEGAYRRLFVENSAQGIHFVETLRNRFHVVLMNPPFGDPSTGSKKYIDDTYPRTRNDLYAAFVERFLHRLVPGGYLGVITSRTGFFLTTFQAWREEVLLDEAELVTLADLGHGVLDTAMVETAAYCLRRPLDWI